MASTKKYFTTPYYLLFGVKTCLDTNLVMVCLPFGRSISLNSNAKRGFKKNKFFSFICSYLFTHDSTVQRANCSTIIGPLEINFSKAHLIIFFLFFFFLLKEIKCDYILPAYWV